MIKALLTLAYAIFATVFFFIGWTIRKDSTGLSEMFNADLRKRKFGPFSFFMTTPYRVRGLGRYFWILGLGMLVAALGTAFRWL